VVLLELPGGCLVSDGKILPGQLGQIIPGWFILTMRHSTEIIIRHKLCVRVQIYIMFVPEIQGSCLMLMYSPLSAYFDDVIPQQPALSNDSKQQQPALGDFTSPIVSPF
jgi:hypothetical protein